MRFARTIGHFTLCSLGVFACTGGVGTLNEGARPYQQSDNTIPPTGSGGETPATSSDAGAGSDATGGGKDSGKAPVAGGLFTQPAPWTKRIDGLTKNVESDAIIAALTASGGWGTGTFKMDMSIEVLKADASTPLKPFTPTDDFYSPDCDNVPFPVPVGGALEGETGYACTGDGDCHLLVVHPPTNKLFEMWRANIDSSGFRGGCVSVWDLAKAYPSDLRGDGCTSADAGGFPITAMLATADEVAAGTVAHALRFILPNARIRKHVFVHPGTHTTGPTNGGPNAPPYGVRLRLRASYNLSSLPTQGARVLAKALQEYGMFLADGGQVPLTVRSDRSTVNKWSAVGVNEQSLGQIQPNDLEVVDMGTPITSNPDCARNP